MLVTLLRNQTAQVLVLKTFLNLLIFTKSLICMYACMYTCILTPYFTMPRIKQFYLLKNTFTCLLFGLDYVEHSVKKSLCKLLQKQ